MKIRVRAKSGGVLTVTDENGHPIEGLVDARLEAKLGDVPVVKLTIRGSSVVLDETKTDRVIEDPTRLHDGSRMEDLYVKGKSRGAETK